MRVYSMFFSHRMMKLQDSLSFWSPKVFFHRLPFFFFIGILRIDPRSQTIMKRFLHSFAHARERPDIALLSPLESLHSNSSSGFVSTFVFCFLIGSGSSERKFRKWLQEYVEKFVILNKHRKWFHIFLEIFLWSKCPRVGFWCQHV